MIQIGLSSFWLIVFNSRVVELIVMIGLLPIVTAAECPSKITKNGHVVDVEFHSNLHFLSHQV